MKDNHIPAKDRIKRRIFSLKLKLDAGWGHFGHGNPYRRCNRCNKAEPEISISGHGKGCAVAGIIKQLAHYEDLLTELTKGEEDECTY